MKALIAAVVVLGVAAFPNAGSSLEVSAQSGFHVDYWSGNLDESGHQVHVPIRFDFQQENFYASILSGYAATSFQSDDGDDASLSRPLDTKVGLSYAFLGLLPVDFLVGLDFNLPTGKTDLRRSDLPVIMDPDLVSITGFGEGFNVNPTLSVARVFGKTSVGIAAGYTWRGEYDFSRELQDYDPGDVFNLRAELRHDFGSGWQWALFGEFATFGEDTVSDDDFFEAGDTYHFGTTVQHVRTNWDLGFTLRAVFREENDFRDRRGALRTEDENSFGNEYVAALSFGYVTAERTRLRTTAAFLLIEENDYDGSSPAYADQREKYSLGLSAERDLNPNLTASLHAVGFVLHERERFSHPEDHLTAPGFSLGLSLTSRF